MTSSIRTDGASEIVLPPNIERTLERATVALMKEVHRGQKRKSGGPYSAHPMRAFKLVKIRGGTLVARLAEILHDTKEMTAITDREIDQKIFSPVIALAPAYKREIRLVQARTIEVLDLLTHLKSQLTGLYLFELSEDKDANLGKGCDALDNLRDPIPLEVIEDDIRKRILEQDLSVDQRAAAQDAARQFARTEQQRIDMKFRMSIGVTATAEVVLHHADTGFNPDDTAGGFSFRGLWRNWWNEEYLGDMEERVAKCPDQNKLYAAEDIYDVAATVRRYSRRYEPQLFAKLLDEKGSDHVFSLRGTDLVGTEGEISA